MIVRTSTGSELIEPSVNKKQRIGDLARQMGLARENDSWVKIINEVSVHFSVWHGWSLDRLTALPLEEITSLLELELELKLLWELGLYLQHYYLVDI